MHRQRLRASADSRACSVHKTTGQHVAFMPGQATTRSSACRFTLGKELGGYLGKCTSIKGWGLLIPHALSGTTTMATQTVAQEQAPVAAEQLSTDAQPFSWTSYWWPLQAIENLEPKVPLHVDLLGKSLVVWGDSKGNWHCMEDKCPHRLAPLSEGRVEKDNIMCCYHGWTFSGSGQCTSIPQLSSDSKAHASACSSKRSCVATYPTKVHNGLLWIWPESGLEAEQKAAQQQPMGMHSKGHNTWYVRDLPLRFDTLVENVMDGSHVQFAHHGVQGSRYEKVNHWNKQSLHGEAASKQGWYVTADAPGKVFGDTQWSCHFNPPYEVVYHVDGEILGPQSALVPLKPGWTRIITNFNLQNKALQTKIPPIVRLLFKLRLRSVANQHVTGTNLVLDGDTYMLHVAERLLPTQEGIGWGNVASKYYSPSTADTPVIAWRKWLQQFGPAPTCLPTDVQPPLMSKEQVLNRWEQHTKNCSHCKTALASLDRTLMMTTFLGLAAAVATVAQLIAGAVLARISTSAAASTQSAVSAAIAGWWATVWSTGMQLPMLACTVVALACWAWHRHLTNLRQKFFYEDYVHATRD